MATSTAAAPPAPDPNVSTVGLAHKAGEEIERTCTDCNQVKPLDSIVRTNSIGERPRYLHTCKPCRNASRAEAARRRRESGHTLSSSSERERRSKMREAFGHAQIEAAPDAAVLRLLRELLAEDRLSGWDFDQAFDDDVEFVLARITQRPERKSWREALHATRHAWQAAYDRVPGPGAQLTPELLVEPASNRASASIAA
jgi:hypothetical protein